MFKIKITDELYHYCEKLVEQYNFGQRKKANGTKEQQLTGIIGQCAVLELFGLPRVDGESGFDNGIDFTFNQLKIDVKTMGRTTDVRPNYTNNFLKLQDYFETEIYIFCSYNKNKKEVTVCGWIDKENFSKRRKYFPKGSYRTRSDGTQFITFSDLYEIDMSYLNDVLSIEELQNQLENYKK